MKLRFAFLSVLSLFLGVVRAQDMPREQKAVILQAVVQSFRQPLPEYQTLSGETEIRVSINLGFIPLQMEGGMTEKVEYDAIGKYRSEKTAYINSALEKRNILSTTVINDEKGWEMLDDSVVTVLDPTTIAAKLNEPLLGVIIEDIEKVPLVGSFSSKMLNQDLTEDSPLLDSIQYLGMRDFEGSTCHVFGLISADTSKKTLLVKSSVLIFVDSEKHLLRGLHLDIDPSALNFGNEEGATELLSRLAKVGIIRIRMTSSYPSDSLYGLPSESLVTISSDSNLVAGTMSLHIHKIVLNPKLKASRFKKPVPSKR